MKTLEQAQEEYEDICERIEHLNAEAYELEKEIAYIKKVNS